MAQSTGVVRALFLPREDTAERLVFARDSAYGPYREPSTRSKRNGRPAVTAEMLPQLIPYTPPLARDSERCPCGESGRTCEESMCRPCRELAVATHGQRLTRLLSTIRYDHRGVRLSWTESQRLCVRLHPPARLADARRPRPQRAAPPVPRVRVLGRRPAHRGAARRRYARRSGGHRARHHPLKALVLLLTAQDR